jgi:hypothetical protein
MQVLIVNGYTENDDTVLRPNSANTSRYIQFKSLIAEAFRSYKQINISAFGEDNNNYIERRIDQIGDYVWKRS